MSPTTQRTLEADGFRGTTLVVLLVFGLLSAWGAWFIGAQVALYAVSDRARLEMSQAAHPVEAPVAGRVVATYLVLARKCRAATCSSSSMLPPNTCIWRKSRPVGRAAPDRGAPYGHRRRTAGAARVPTRRRGALDEARAAARGRGSARRQMKSEVFARLQARGLPAQIEAWRAKAEAQKRRAAADASGREPTGQRPPHARERPQSAPRWAPA